MEDTHAYLYNFLSTPAPVVSGEVDSKPTNSIPDGDITEPTVQETDNGYFAIFDGHAGTFAADWCGKKLHHILEDTIRKNPNTPLPELLDQTFTIVDQQLEKLPLKNSGCTAVIAVLRWEDRVPNPASATGSSYINQAAAKSISESKEPSKTDSEVGNEVPVSQPNSEVTIINAEPARESASSESKLKDSASRQRVLYTANVGDARIVLCRNGRALRLSYDHKGSDENEGRRVANAGGLILNNRVNGVLAVTRALGDAYMKDLVTGHPYTTETVIQPDQDEFIILACDGVSFDFSVSPIARSFMEHDNVHDTRSSSTTSSRFPPRFKTLLFEWRL
jgi:protein phosphatase PTC1